MLILLETILLLLFWVIIYFMAVPFQKQSPSKTDFSGGLIFGTHVQSPKRYGIVELDADEEVKSIEENPITQNLTLPFQVFISLTILYWKKQHKSSPVREANSKSQIFTMHIGRQVSWVLLF